MEHLVDVDRRRRLRVAVRGRHGGTLQRTSAAANPHQAGGPVSSTGTCGLRTPGGRDALTTAAHLSSATMIASLTALVDSRDLLRNFLSRDLRVRYKASTLGIVWSLLN